MANPLPLNDLDGPLQQRYQQRDDDETRAWIQSQLALEGPVVGPRTGGQTDPRTGREIPQLKSAPPEPKPEHPPLAEQPGYVPGQSTTPSWVERKTQELGALLTEISNFILPGGKAATLGVGALKAAGAAKVGAAATRAVAGSTRAAEAAPIKARYNGFQQGVQPGEGFQLYTVEHDVPPSGELPNGIVAGSTVSDKTLWKAGYQPLNAPPAPGAVVELKPRQAPRETTVSQPGDFDWEKVASITPGGKPYFYVAFVDTDAGRIKYSVHWDRNARTWLATRENMRTDLIATELGQFHTEKEARAFITETERPQHPEISEQVVNEIADTLKSETGKISAAQAVLLARSVAGGLIGAATGEDDYTHVRNALIGAGLAASPELTQAVFKLFRRSQPNKFVAAAQELPQDITSLGETAIKPRMTVGKMDISVNIDAIKSQDDVDKIVDELAGVYKAQMDAGVLPIGSRGVIPDVVAKRLAKHLDLSEEQAMARLRGTALPVEHIFAYADLLDHAETRVLYYTGLYDKGAKDAAKLMTDAVDRYVIVGSQLDGVLEESGRALRAGGLEEVRDPVKRFRNFVGPYEQMVKDGTITPDAVAGLVKRLGVERTAHVGAAIQRAGLWDMVSEVVYGFTLSNPRTSIVNVGGNVIVNPFLTISQRAWAGLVGQSGEVQGLGEAMQMLYAYWRGVSNAAKAVTETYEREGGILGMLRTINDFVPDRSKIVSIREGRADVKAITGENVSNLLAGRKATAWAAFDPNGYIGKLVDGFGAATRVPGKIMELGDQFGHAVNFDMAAAARAYREGTKNGLEGDALRAYIDNELSNPSRLIKEEAEQFAQHEIFKQSFDGKLGAMVEALGHPMLRPAITFVRTPLNIFRYSLEGVPGVNLMLKQVREDLLAGGARADLAMSKMTMSSSVMGLVGLAAAGGYITGKGPDNPELRRIWLVDHQPYSIKVGDKWIAYNLADPIASWFGMAADMVGMLNYDSADFKQRHAEGTLEQQSEEWGQYALGLSLAFMRNFTNKTYAKDAFEFLNLISAQAGETGQSALASAETYFNNRARMFVPGVVAATGQFIDPTQREVNGWLDTLKSRIPGWSYSLPAKLDYFGDEIVDYRGKPFLPFPIAKKESDPVADEMLRVHAATPRIPQIVDGEELTSQEKHDYLKTRGYGVMGRPLREGLLDLMKSEAYQSKDKTDELRKIMIHETVQSYNDATVAALSQKYEKFLKLKQRINEAEKIIGHKIHVGQ